LTSSDRHLETLLNASMSTLERRRRGQKNLDPVASERLDRIATVSHLAEEIFETPVTATDWMSTPNTALGGDAPIMLCETELGGKQVRRVLQSLEWGGPAWWGAGAAHTHSELMSFTTDRKWPLAQAKQKGGDPW